MTTVDDTTGLRFSDALQTRELPDGRWCVLGPGLQLFELPRWPLAVDDLDDETVRDFLRCGFLVPEVHTTPMAPPTTDVGISGTIVHGAGRRARCAAVRLAEALGPTFGVLEHSAGFVDRLAPGGVAIWLQQVESLRPLDEIDGLLQRGVAVLWFGETTQGLHVGPLFRSSDEVVDYGEATKHWAHARELCRLGFDDVWPLSTLDRIVARPLEVANAIQAVLDAPSYCVTVPGLERVALWTTLRAGPLRLADFRRTQRWAKGALSNTTVERMPGGGYLGTATPPVFGIAALEGCQGKGLTEAQAMQTAMGEAVERFTAMDALRRLPAQPPLAELSPKEFHTYDDADDCGEIAGFEAMDLVSGDPVLVPERLVPFPYLPPPSRQARPGDTCGLAVYPTREGAIVRGAQEILERNNLYPNLRHLRPAKEVSQDRASLPQTTALMQRVHAELDAKIWLLVYPEPSEVPIVQAFVWDRQHGHISRGSGSKGTFDGAATHALLEAMTLREQHEHLRCNPELPRGPGYIAWACASTIAFIADYLDRQPLGQCDAFTAANDVELLERVREHCRRQARPLLVADLVCPVSEWHAVRVLIPGLTCHGRASKSAGGDRLRGAPFSLPIPN